jgi:PKD repeat protein
MRARPALLVIAALATAVATWAATPVASADTPGGELVAERPAPGTPHVLDGRVYSVVQVGDTIVLGGSFTRARNDSGDTAVVTRNGLLAFSASTGKIDPAFRPNPNGTVRTVLPAPDGSTVYVGGAYTSIAGASRQRLARIRVSDGGLVTGFNPGAITGQVRDLELADGRLWVGGAFTHVGGRGQTALTTVDPTTGAPQGYMSLPLAGYHNEGATQVLQMDLAPDGSRLAAVGNFDTLAGVRNHQFLMLDLTGPSAAPGPWWTDFYTDPCASVFDSYMRDVDFSPDGSYLVVSTTGAYGGPSTACDTVARFETASTGADVRPSWIDHTGGDTTYAVEATDAAVYVGGHQRWWNNPFAGDRPGPGAVSREGIAALDPSNGLPLDWDPTRDKGVGVFDYLLTARGLWVASDTDRIGDYQYRGRIALLPSGGSSYPAVRTPRLPADVYLGGSAGTSPDPRVLYRVNAGGPSLVPGSGPAWDADTTTDPSPYHSSGQNSAGYGAIPAVTPAVPAGTPRAVFATELWDPSPASEQEWDFPVPAVTPLEFRLYFANRYSGTSQPGQRVFDVAIDGTTVLDDYDIVAAAGPDVGTVEEFTITSDGTVDIDLAHVVENPLVNGIEILRTDLPAPTPTTGGLQRRSFDGSTAGATGTAPAGGIDWDRVRGAFMVGETLYTATDDGALTSRRFTGTTYGPASPVDTADRIVALAAWHDDVAASTGMFLDGGRLYFTRAGDPRLYYRYFTPSSGVVGAQRLQVATGLDLSGARGMFVTDSHLFWATTDGDLHRAAWSQGAQSGAPVPGTEQVVSGPGVDGTDWAARTLFVGPEGSPDPVTPTASFSESCTGQTCTFDGTASTTPGGTPTYLWQFGDGASGSGPTPSHPYAAAGTYTVTLTVTSSAGGTASTSRQVTVQPPTTGGITFVAADSSAGNTDRHRLTVPGAVRPGDTLVAYLTLNNTAVTISDPAGWTVLDSVVGTGIQGRSWTRTATAADAGSTLTVPTSGYAKDVFTLEAYRSSGGESRVVDHAISVQSGSATQHTAPAVTVPPGGGWVSRHWVAKRSGAVTWTAPPQLEVRTSAAGAGGGRLTGIGGDLGAAVAPGDPGGDVATSDPAVTRTLMFSVVHATG